MKQKMKYLFNRYLRESLGKTKRAFQNKILKRSRFSVPKLPNIVHLEVTTKCNLRCIMCRDPDDKSMIEGKFVPYELFQKILPYGKNLEFFNFVGYGEIFVNSDFERMFDDCHKNGLKNLACTTNLQIVDEKMAEKIVLQNFKHMTVSIDGCTKKTFEEIRVGADFDRLINIIKNINKYKKKYDKTRPTFTFYFVAMKRNIHELPGLIRLAKELGVCAVGVIRLAVNHERMIEESLYFHKDIYNRYHDEAVKLAKELSIQLDIPPKFGDPPKKTIGSVRDCTAPFKEVFISLDGTALPCCRSGLKYQVGNLTDKTLEEVWHGEEFNKFRKAMFSDSPPQCCRECTLIVDDVNKIESHMSPPMLALYREKDKKEKAEGTDTQ